MWEDSNSLSPAITFCFYYRYNDQFVMATFDGEPLADTEGYKGLDQEMRDECESRVFLLFIFIITYMV